MFCRKFQGLGFFCSSEAVVGHGYGRLGVLGDFGFFACIGLSLVLGASAFPLDIALPRDMSICLPSLRPIRGLASWVSHPGFRFAPRWATILAALHFPPFFLRGASCSR